MRTGGQILIDCLAANGVTHVFTVPGESFLAALDAMHDDARIAPIACRNESGAAIMAEAAGKLTGRPGVALVTRGPGAANAYSGVYIAQQDASPMVLLVGLPPRAMLTRDAFQAIDVRRAFAAVAKWCVVAASADAIADLIARALRTAMAGRPGPVVIGLPEDVLNELSDAEQIVLATPKDMPPTAADLADLRAALAHAERPLVIVGGNQWSAEASANLAIFAERFDLPVACAFRRQDHFDNRNACYAGHAGLAMDESLRAGFRIADVVIAIGTRLGDVTSDGFRLFGPDAAEKGMKLIRIAADAGPPDGAYPHAVQISANPIAAVTALARLDLPGKVPPWGVWRRDLRAAHLATLKPRPSAGAVRLETVITTLARELPPDAIVTNGAGNYAAFLHRYFVYRNYPTQLAPISGSMGYGLPAAIAAKLLHPDRVVVAIAGDGCFQMTGVELSTAAQYGAGVVVIIANNGALGTIRMHQERQYPGRVVATSLINPDFVALAESCGASAERVAATADFAGALARAITAVERTHRPAVIELMLDIEAISPSATLSETRLQARRAPPSEA